MVPLAAAIVLLRAIAAVGAPLTVLYTNDLHLRFARLDSLEHRIEEVRAEADSVLLVDAGDAWHDFRRPLTAVWGADEMVSWMNQVGYDAMALGNHDLYWGALRLAVLARAADFPILCANAKQVGSARVPFVASTRVLTTATPVLVIGLITEEFLPYPAYPGLRLVGPAGAVREEIRHRATDADLILVLAHLPVADAADLARAVPEIDLLVSGHSHETTFEPLRIGQTWIVQSGAFGAYLGKLVLDVDPHGGRHRLIANELLPTEKAPTAPGRGLRRLLSVLTAAVAVALFVLR